MNCPTRTLRWVWQARADCEWRECPGRAGRHVLPRAEIPPELVLPFDKTERTHLIQCLRHCQGFRGRAIADRFGISEGAVSTYANSKSSHNSGKDEHRFVAARVIPYLRRQGFTELRPYRRGVDLKPTGPDHRRYVIEVKLGASPNDIQSVIGQLGYEQLFGDRPHARRYMAIPAETPLDEIALVRLDVLERVLGIGVLLIP